MIALPALLPVPSVWATGVYYVDALSPACSTSGPGTEPQPYCTISAAVAAHNGAGTTIVVRPGIYREQVSIPASGVSGSPFTVQANGPGVVLDGADDFADPSLWTPASGTTWVASAVTWSPIQMFADEVRLAPSVSAADLLPVGAFTWVSGQGLFVNLGGDNPGLHASQVGRRNYGFTMYAKSWIVIDGFTVARAESRGVYLQNACSNVTVARIHESLSGDIGLQAVGGSGLSFEQNVAGDNLGHGIALISGATGCVVRDNECYGNADAKTRLANGIYLFNAPSNALYRNRLHDNQDSGMHIQSGSNDCVSSNNLSWKNGDHGYDHLNVTGTKHACDVAYGNYRDGFSIEGYASGTHLHDCVAVENGLTTNRYDLWVDANSISGFESDYNVFWNSTAQSPVKFVTTLYPSVAAYAAASGQDGNTFQADPRFVSATTGDFHLSPDSPAIDSGDSGAPEWPAQDAEGRAREDDPGRPNIGAGAVPFAERGAFERSGSTLDVPERAPAVQLVEVFPNPLAGHGTLRFRLARPGPLSVRILDLTGRVVRTLADLREAPAGRIELPMADQGDDGRRLGAGVYFYRVETSAGAASGRFVLVR